MIAPTKRSGSLEKISASRLSSQGYRAFPGPPGVEPPNTSLKYCQGSRRQSGSSLERAGPGTNRGCRELKPRMLRRQPPARKETSMNVAGFVATTDEELIVHAMRDAQLLLAEHIERGPTDAEEAITQLLEILDRQDVVAATNRLCQEYGLRPLK
jgi:hypothetical protein